MRHIDLELQWHGYKDNPSVRAYEIDPGVYVGRSTMWAKSWVLYHHSGLRASTVGFVTRKAVIDNYRRAVEQHGAVDWDRDSGDLDIPTIRKIVDTMNEHARG